MVLFNYSTKEITAKIVYYGPGLCGKTTNLQFIYDNLPSSINKGKMLSLATKTDRTLFFDFLPIDLGTIRGLRTRLQLYTVPGQVFYNTTRKLVLKGADGVVFVADSQKRMAEANLESFRNLEENLAEHGMKVAEIPLILQFNKRDLPDVMTVEEMNAQLNKYNSPIYEGVATTGIGVHETLRAATRLVLNSLKERYAEKKEAGVGTIPPPAPGVAKAQASVTTASPARPAAPAPSFTTPPASPMTAPAAAPRRPAAPPPPAAAARSPQPHVPEILPLSAADDSDVEVTLVDDETPAPAAEAADPVLELAAEDEIELELIDDETPAGLVEDTAPRLDSMALLGDTSKSSPFSMSEEPEAEAPSAVESLFGMEEDGPAISIDGDSLGDSPLSLGFGQETPEIKMTAPPEPQADETVHVIDMDEPESLGLGLEDTHDDLLGLGASQPKMPVSTAPVRQTEPTRVVAVQASASGQQEIQVPIQLAIGDKSIRFELRISLDLATMTSAPGSGSEDFRR